MVSLEKAGFDKGLWDTLGMKLGLYPNTLGVIAKNKGDVDSCFTECLSKWLKRADGVDDAGLPTWYSLADALGKMKECKDQADAISKYITEHIIISHYNNIIVPKHNISHHIHIQWQKCMYCN